MPKPLLTEEEEREIMSELELRRHLTLKAIARRRRITVRSLCTIIDKHRRKLRDALFELPDDEDEAHA